MIEDKLDIIIALLEEISDRLYEQPVNTRVDNNKFLTKEDMLSKDDTK
jgi:hypothetical protein